jgi:hypothetical protein
MTVGRVVQTTDFTPNPARNSTAACYAKSFNCYDPTCKPLISFELDWLPFLNTYRTMCRAPEPAFRQILEDVRELRFAA